MKTTTGRYSGHDCRGDGRVSDLDADRFAEDLAVLMDRARSKRPDPSTPAAHRPVPWGPDVSDLLGFDPKDRR